MAAPISVWAPEPTVLQACVAMLESALSPDPARQKLAYDTMQQNATNPNFLQYLVYCVVYGTTLASKVRAVAGATAKTVLSRCYGDLLPDVRAYVKAEMVKLLIDPDGGIRRTAANVVSSIAREDEELCKWPELPGILGALLDMHANPAALDGVLTVFEQITDDVPQLLDDAELGNPLNVLLPKLIGFMGHPEEALRLKATRSVANLMHTGAPALAANQGALLRALGVLTADPSPAIRCTVSTALATLVETDLVSAWPAIREILAFQLRCVNDPDRAVATAGCDFWPTWAEHIVDYREDKPEYFLGPIEPVLPELTRSLIARMVLTDEEGAGDADAADSHREERESEVNPDGSRRVGRAGAGGGAVSGIDGAMGGAGAAAPAPAAPAGADEEDEEDDEDDEDKGRNPNEGAEYTVRRAAGHALEIISLVYSDQVLPLAMAEIGARIVVAGDTRDAWLTRETAVLAIGCLAYGCKDIMTVEHMRFVLLHLLHHASDGRAALRSSTAWALAKYSGWLWEQQAMQSEDRDAAQARGDAAGVAACEFVMPTLAVLVRLAVDPVRKVQLAALSAFMEFAETGGEDLAPYAPDLLGALLSNYGKYTLSARLMFYDCVSTLAESCSEAFATAGMTPTLMAGLMSKFEALDPDTHEVVVVASCLSACFGAVGVTSKPLVPRALARCCPLLQRELVHEAAAAASRTMTAFASAEERRAAFRAQNSDIGRLCAYVDLLDALVDIGQADVEGALAAAAVPEGLQLLLDSPSAKLRTSSCALLGTMVRFVPRLLAGGLKEMGRLIAPSIRYTKDNDNACNNAVWALGIIVKTYGREAAPVLTRCLDRLVEVLSVKDKPRVVYENVAITLGRVGSVFEDVLRPGAGAILQRWCVAITRVTDEAERIDAFAGLCAVIAGSPAAARAALKPVVKAFASYGSETPPPMLEMMRRAFAAVRAITPPEELAAVAAGLSDEDRAFAARLL